MNHFNSTFKVKPTKPKPRKPWVRKAAKRSRLQAKRKTKADLWREYGLERPTKPRYVGLKGIYWHVLSQLVRRRDFRQYGKCVNCGRAVSSWQEFHAGHYLAAERCGWLLLFDKTNVNGECPSCNHYDKQKLGYEKNLDIRYGAGTAFGLKKRYWESKQGTPAKEWGQLEYHREILKLQKELSLLT